jgi:type II secretory pathway component PulJ
MNTETFGFTVLRVVLALGLLAGLGFAGWRIYSRLPEGDAIVPQTVASEGRAQTRLRIVLGDGLSAAALSSPVELYPFDLTAVQREYQASPQLGKTFDAFLARRMRGVTPVHAPTDPQGRAVVSVGAGSWWLRAAASLASGETIEWRLPMTVQGREQTVELTLENAYERTKKF